MKQRIRPEFRSRLHRGPAYAQGAMRVRGLHLSSCSLGQALGGIQVRSCQQANEFIAAYPGNQIFLTPEYLSQQRGKHLETIVPSRMSVCVVEFLEMIDVDRDDGNAVTLAAHRP